MSETTEMIKEFNKGDLLYIDEDRKAYWGFPQGYPYKGSRVTVDLKPLIGEDIVLCKVSDNTPEPLPVGSHVLVRMRSNGDKIGEYSVSSASGSHFVVNYNMVFVVYENNYSMNGAVFPEKGVYFMRNNSTNFAITGVAWDINATEPDITWDGVVETIHTMATEFLPSATSTTHGTVKQVPYLPNATGDAPTAENFNQLVRGLKSAGLMK